MPDGLQRIRIGEEEEEQKPVVQEVGHRPRVIDEEAETGPRLEFYLFAYCLVAAPLCITLRSDSILSHPKY